GRHYAGYDLDESYIRLAEARVAGERRRVAEEPAPVRPAGPLVEVARAVLAAAGLGDVRPAPRLPGGVQVALAATDRLGRPWLFDLAGGLTSHRPGLRRSDALWKAVATAAVVQQVQPAPLVLLTPALPAPGTTPAQVLAAVTGPGRAVRAVVDVLDPRAPADLAEVVAGPA
ncbi:MAG TPA: hypothetical protein VKV25_03060, partial [Acidimicrobiales bacterium]|nr:hypothetical protein [Acidimicrobiales bacterium]